MCFHLLIQDLLHSDAQKLENEMETKLAQKFWKTFSDRVDYVKKKEEISDVNFQMTLKLVFGVPAQLKDDMKQKSHHMWLCLV